MLVKINDRTHPFHGWLAIIDPKSGVDRWRVKEWVNPENQQRWESGNYGDCWLGRGQVKRVVETLEKTEKEGKEK